MRLEEHFKKLGEDRFVSITEGAFDTDFNIDVQIGEEKINPALLVQSITQALGVAAQFPNTRLKADEAIREIFDALGLDGERMIGADQTLGESQAQQTGMEAGQEAQNNPQPGRNEAILNPTPASRPVV